MIDIDEILSLKAKITDWGDKIIYLLDNVLYYKNIDRETFLVIEMCKDFAKLIKTTSEKIEEEILYNNESSE